MRSRTTNSAYEVPPYEGAQDNDPQHTELDVLYHEEPANDQSADERLADEMPQDDQFQDDQRQDDQRSGRLAA